jgi:hypothetical protein
MQAILKQNHITRKVVNKNPDMFGEKIGVFGKVFGCWHKALTRPFTTGRQSYRACLECGARRRFDPQTLKTLGAFYYPPPAVSADGDAADRH